MEKNMRERGDLVKNYWTALLSNWSFWKNKYKMVIISLPHKQTKLHFFIFLPPTFLLSKHDEIKLIFPRLSSPLKIFHPALSNIPTRQDGKRKMRLKIAFGTNKSCGPLPPLVYSCTILCGSRLHMFYGHFKSICLARTCLPWVPSGIRKLQTGYWLPFMCFGNGSWISSPNIYSLVSSPFPRSLT